MVVGELAHHLCGAIGGIIINEKDLQIAETAKRQQLGDDRRDIIALVVSGQHHRKAQRRRRGRRGGAQGRCKGPKAAKTNAETLPDLASLGKACGFKGLVLLDVLLEHAVAVGVAKLAQCLGLNLADAFAGDIKDLTDFLQSFHAAIVKAIAKTQHVALAG